MVQEIKAAFQKEEFVVEVHPLSYFQDDYGFKYGLKDGEEDEDDKNSVDADSEEGDDDEDGDDDDDDDDEDEEMEEK